ncbi:DUF58 domain-containing protein [Taibaiella helva]|uniref:DUF58 domain-containing protein n=1 Tax=Taibaiella helva TaxID=2301235 RepID=UPI000E5771AA|nr:DUF58 domain-containing protein [Taibaiella helva]
MIQWKNLRTRLRYYGQYFPLTLNAFVVAIALWLCFKIVKPAEPVKGEDISSFKPLILLMGKTALWFVVALIGFSVLTTFLCWLHYLWLRRRHRYQLEFEFRPAEKNKGLWIETLLRKARRPFLGFIKGRLFYDDRHMTDKFPLASNKRKAQQFWREGVAGKSRILLPDIKEYAINGGAVYFEDMLQLFSLPVIQKVKGHFYQAPDQVQLHEKEALPRKTEQTDTRIDQLRKVEGEYLNYKGFEGGDDVRRIVWKVYAKSRELVVRVPEIFDPYASHVYFYASFHTSIRSGQRHNDFAAEMLNYYKERVWTAYETLTGREWEVRFIPDQQLQVPEQLNGAAFVQRVISNSAWHRDRELTGYFEPRYGSVLCISSFNDPAEVAQLLDQCSAETVVYYVKLSDTFRTFLPWTWLKRLFLLTPEDRLKRIRGRWLLSPLRVQLIRREKEIERALQNSNVTVGNI